MAFVATARANATAPSASPWRARESTKYTAVTTYEQRVTSESGADDWSATTGSEAKSRAPNAACRAVNPSRLEIPDAATTVASSASSWKRLAKRSLLRAPSPTQT